MGVGRLLGRSDVVCVALLSTFSHGESRSTDRIGFWSPSTASSVVFNANGTRVEGVKRISFSDVPYTESNCTGAEEGLRTARTHEVGPSSLDLEPVYRRLNDYRDFSGAECRRLSATKDPTHPTSLSFVNIFRQVHKRAVLWRLHCPLSPFFFGKF